MAAQVLPHDVVWLVPRTLGAPAICWRQPQGVVVRLDWPHVVVTVDGHEYRVHHANVTRTNPQYAKPTRPKTSARPTLAGCEEIPLW